MIDELFHRKIENDKAPRLEKLKECMFSFDPVSKDANWEEELSAPKFESYSSESLKETIFPNSIKMRVFDVIA